MLKKVQILVGSIVVCVVIAMLSGCSEEEKKTTPTAPLDSTSLTNIIASNASPSEKILPDGFFDVFDVPLFPTNLSRAILEQDGRAVPSSREEGFLCYGQNRTGYPGIPLRAVFSVLIDNNTTNNETILVLDVYDRLSNKILAQRKVARRDFPKANAYSLFEVNFIPPVGQYVLEFRIYYIGWAYVRANKIAVVNPVKVSVADVAAEFIQPAAATPVPGQTSPTPATPTPVPTTVPTPRPTPTPVPTSSNSGYCNGDEILCFPEMTAQLVAQHGGTVRGGAFQNGRYLSSSNGGIIVPLTINAGRSLTVEFEIEGNIANWQKGENNGGKVSLFTMKGNGNNYYVSLQRMYRDYRGGGLFRLILGDRRNILDEGGAFLITHSSISGNYSMENWGSEPHEFKVSLSGGSCQLEIDSFNSRPASARYSISGQRRVTLVIGNREAESIGYGQGALTRFRKFKVTY